MAEQENGSMRAEIVISGKNLHLPIVKWSLFAIIFDFFRHPHWVALLAALLAVPALALQITDDRGVSVTLARAAAAHRHAAAVVDRDGL